MDEIEIALLLRLIETGECKSSARAETLLERFCLAQWIEPARRQDFWKVRSSATQALQKRIADLSPSWIDDAKLLRGNGLNPFEPRSYHALSALKAAYAPVGYLHRKTWNAATAAGSKRASQLPTTAQLTDDWSVRGRVSCATSLVTARGAVNLFELTQKMTEFSISERCWLSSRGWAGAIPKNVLTVENLSPLVDVVLPKDTMLLFCPGTAVNGVAHLLRTLPRATWMHFGDLDAAGVQIALSLAQMAGRSPSLYIPTFADEYLDKGLRADQRWGVGSFDIPVLHTLSNRKRWLEQEIFILDQRLHDDIELALSALAQNQVM
jgi:hypothetical protein